MIAINWYKDGWHVFPLESINHMSRNHAINLFGSAATPVVIKQDAVYFVNKPDLLSKYRNSKKRVTLISDCGRSDKRLSEVGFL